MNGTAISGATLNSTQKSKIRELFPDNAKIDKMDIDQVKNNLRTLDLPPLEINDISSPDEARQIAQKLLSAAKN